MSLPPALLPPNWWRVLERDMRRLDEFSEYAIQTSRLIEKLERRNIELHAENTRLRKKVAFAQYAFPFMLGAICGACLIIIFR